MVKMALAATEAWVLTADGRAQRAVWAICRAKKMNHAAWIEQLS